VHAQGRIVDAIERRQQKEAEEASLMMIEYTADELRRAFAPEPVPAETR
jgi:DNA-binding GntR family transcriptional regulator